MLPAIPSQTDIECDDPSPIWGFKADEIDGFRRQLLTWIKNPKWPRADRIKSARILVQMMDVEHRGRARSSSARPRALANLLRIAQQQHETETKRLRG